MAIYLKIRHRKHSFGTFASGIHRLYSTFQWQHAAPPQRPDHIADTHPCSIKVTMDFSENLILMQGQVLLQNRTRRVGWSWSLRQRLELAGRGLPETWDLFILSTFSTLTKYYLKAFSLACPETKSKEGNCIPPNTGYLHETFLASSNGISSAKPQATWPPSNPADSPLPGALPLCVLSSSHQNLLPPDWPLFLLRKKA